METLNWVLILKSYEIVELKAYIYLNIRMRRLPQNYLPTFIYLYPQKQTNVTHCSRASSIRPTFAELCWPLWLKFCRFIEVSGFLFARKWQTFFAILSVFT